MGLDTWPALDMKSLLDIPYDGHGSGGSTRVKTEPSSSGADVRLEPLSMSSMQLPAIAASTREKRGRSDVIGLAAVAGGGETGSDAQMDDAVASDALSDVTHQAEVSQWNKHMSKCNKRAKAMQARLRTVITRAEERATAHSNSPPAHPPTHRHHRRRRP